MSAFYRLPSLVVGIAFIVVGIVALAGPRAAAQNLDQDKSGAKLFATTCAECHRSARGLARGRLSFTLSYYLRQHYTSGAESAAALTAYLQSVDTPPPGKGKQAARKSSTTTVGASTRRPLAIGASEPAKRPPASVPSR